jgi:hypothetical protein
MSLEAIMASQKQQENSAQTPWLYWYSTFANERHRISSALKQWHLLHPALAKLLAQLHRKANK